MYKFSLGFNYHSLLYIYLFVWQDNIPVFIVVHILVLFITNEARVRVFLQIAIVRLFIILLINVITYTSVKVNGNITLSNC